jgi:ABC-2 type transport system permease protein
MLSPGSPSPPSAATNLTQSAAVIQRLMRHLQALQTSVCDPNSDVATTHQQIGAVRQDISDLRALTAQFGAINPYALAAPLYGKAENLSPVGALDNSQTVFYAPGVLALLLQHMAITLSALSMVRERESGRLEIFRVAPITPGEILAGKYVGFGLFLSVLALVLVVLLGLGLGVPIFGPVGWLAAVLVFLIWASLSAGFVISMLAQTQRQAVQMTMLALLASVFFSGLFVPADAFKEPIRTIADVLPATHAVLGLQEVMLKGAVPGGIHLLALALLGLAAALFARWRLGVAFKNA